MSDSLEALTQAHDLIMHNTVIEVMPDGEPDWPEWACDAMNKIKRASAALEQGEAVEYWVLFDASGGPKFIKKEVGSGVLAFFDCASAAKAAKKVNPGTDYKKVVYYKAPPSTAEAAGWRRVADSNLPPLGTSVIICIDGVVQSERFELDCADSDDFTGSGGGYFWSHPDYDPCPEVKESDIWMPWPTLAAAPPSTAEQWKPSGTEYDRNIHNSTDASAWADFFMATFPNCGADRDTMLGWFANAMMAVADSQPSTAESQARALVEFAMSLKQRAQQTHSMFSEGLLHAARYAEAEAKRIREEAK